MDLVQFIRLEKLASPQLILCNSCETQSSHLMLWIVPESKWVCRKIIVMQETRNSKASMRIEKGASNFPGD